MVRSQAPETHARSRLDWRELEREPHASLLDWHRSLIRLRRQRSALSDGRTAQLLAAFDEEARWLVFERGPVTVACNLADQTQRVPLSRRAPGAGLLGSDARIHVEPGGIEMPAESVVVLGPSA